MSHPVLAVALPRLRRRTKRKSRRFFRAWVPSAESEAHAASVPGSCVAETFDEGSQWLGHRIVPVATPLPRRREGERRQERGRSARDKGRLGPQLAASLATLQQSSGGFLSAGVSRRNWVRLHLWLQKMPSRAGGLSRRKSLDGGQSLRWRPACPLASDRDCSHS